MLDQMPHCLYAGDAEHAERHESWEEQMTTFVLVHGAWHGGWCWHKIVPRLRAAGHAAIAPDMKGHGIDRSPTETLTLDSLAEGICAVVAKQGGEVVLVGHSFGGTIITEVGERMPEAIKALVYLTAFVVPGGKSMMDLNAPDPESLIADNLVIAPDGKCVTVNPSRIRDIFYGDCPLEDVALAHTLFVPEGMAAFSTPSSATDARWGRIPSAYIECTRDRAIGIARQRQFASYLKSPKKFSLDCDHSPFFSLPDRLTECLLKLA
jgi:pimeloyl-ACP methyl ester carboxylesterase